MIHCIPPLYTESRWNFLPIVVKARSKNAHNLLAIVETSDLNQISIREREPDEHQASISTMRGWMDFVVTSYSTECVMQSTFKAFSFSSFLHLPSGNEMLNRPKSLWSRMITLPPFRSYMCIATIPPFLSNTSHRPLQPPAAAKLAGIAKRKNRMKTMSPPIAMRKNLILNPPKNLILPWV